ETSTHAPQALELLNGAISNDLAAAFADRLRTMKAPTIGRGESSVDGSVAGQANGSSKDNSPNSLTNGQGFVIHAYLLALGRPPSDGEFAASIDFLRDAPLQEFSPPLFNLNDFAYVP